MLGYYQPQEPAQPEKSNHKRLKLLIQNLENIVKLLKEEVGEDEESNIVSFQEMMQKIENELEEPEYEEED